MGRSTKGKINKLEDALELYMDEQLLPEVKEEVPLKKEVKKEAELELKLKEEKEIQTEMETTKIIKSNDKEQAKLPEKVEVHKELNNKTKSKSKVKTKTQEKVIPSVESIENEKLFLQREADLNMLNEASADENSTAQVNTEIHDIDQDLVALKSRIESNTPKLKFEERKVKRTYWLDEEEIKMVDIIANKAKIDKYEVVGKAIRYLYKKLFYTDSL